jgi:hypothetical protein
MEKEAENSRSTKFKLAIAVAVTYISRTSSMQADS